ncbi:hypothetical protein C1885_13795 [Pseudomonas sp. GW531-R1]|nr:TonB-dependent receptor [Pseudomonas sp. GW531-R1]POA58389.1 hypothetical protein C1885_13795 [Pseudomonas sp. GW531-R1]
MRAQSDINSQSGTAKASQNGYAVYDAMIEYRFDKNYSLQLNGYNLFDKNYYKKIGTAATSYYYGDPSNFSITFRGGFEVDLPQ